MPMFLTRNDESEERHRLPYVWHSRSTWVVSATTEHTDCATKGERCQTVCQWLHMLSMHGPCRQSRACRDALTEMNSLSGVLFTSCLDCVWSLNIGKAADIERAGGRARRCQPQ